MGRSSGRSGADIERILASHAIGVRDPLEYAESWETVLDNALTLDNERGVADE